MAYIYLDELKEILPGILDQWIDEDDESWEWIFQEIEQKCHVGKRCKGKKWKKKLQSMVDTHSVVLSAHRNDINVLTKRVDELSNKISNLSDKYITMVSRVNDMSRNITEARSMAQIAKQRTEVDYSKYSGKSDGEIGYCNPEDKDCKTCKYYHNCYGISDDPCIKCDAYQYWEKKEEQNKSCTNCKYHSDKNSIYNCTCPNGACGSDNKNWEAKYE